MNFPVIHEGEKEVIIHFKQLRDKTHSSLPVRTRITIDIDNKLFPMMRLHIVKTPNDRLTSEMKKMLKLEGMLQTDCFTPDPTLLSDMVKFSINITSQDVIDSRGFSLCVNDTHVLVRGVCLKEAVQISYISELLPFTFVVLHFEGQFYLCLNYSDENSAFGLCYDRA